MKLASILHISTEICAECKHRKIIVKLFGSLALVALKLHLDVKVICLDCFGLYLYIKNDLLPLDTLFELPHSLDESVVDGHPEVARGLVGVRLGCDLPGVLQLGTIDHQLAFLALFHHTNPVVLCKSIRNFRIS